MDVTETEIGVVTDPLTAPLHCQKKDLHYMRSLWTIGDRRDSFEVTKGSGVAQWGLVCLASFRSSELRFARPCNLSQRTHIPDCQSPSTGGCTALGRCSLGRFEGPGSGAQLCFTCFLYWALNVRFCLKKGFCGFKGLK